MIRIAFEISATRFNSTGVAIYASNLLQALREMDSGLEIVPLAVPGWMSRAPHPMVQKVFAAYWQIPYANIVLPRSIRRSGCDLIHYTMTMPVAKHLPCPGVVTVHDIIPYLHPEWLPTVRGQRMRAGLRLSIERAGRLITSTEAVRRDIVAHFGRPAEHISVVPLGAGSKLPSVSRAEADLIVRRHYQLEPGYILCVGTTEPRKNLRRVIEACGRLSRNRSALPPLVIAGSAGLDQGRLRNLVAQGSLKRRVLFTGHIPADHLAALYKSAGVFVYPSLYEGFGFPPLEAMESNCPVIVSDVSSLPEVVGDGAVKVDPEDTSALAEAMGRVLRDERFADELRRRGREWCTQFTWRRCARETLEVYHKMV